MNNATTLPLCDFNISYDLYQGEAFHATERVERTNEFAIRIEGASNDMITLLDGTHEEQADYLVGLVTTSIVFLCTFTFCVILLCIFREIGFRRAGFLCGRFVRPKPPTGVVLTSAHKQERETQQRESQDLVNQTVDSSKNSHFEIDERKSTIGTEKDDFRKESERDQEQRQILERWTKRCKRQETRLIRSRLVLAINLVVITVLCVMFVTSGHFYVNEAFRSVNDGLRSTQKLLLEGILICDTYINAVFLVRNETYRQLESLDPSEFCPANVTAHTDAYCNPVPECIFETLPPELEKDLQEVIRRVHDFTYGSVLFAEELRRDLQTIYDQVTAFLINEEKLEKIFWAAYAFTLTLGLTCLQVLVGLYHIHKRTVGPVIHWVREKVSYIVFVTCLIVAMSLAIAFLIGAIGASDWCINSPDPKVLYILSDNEDKLSSAAYQLMRYYVSGCSASASPEELQRQMEALAQTVRDVADLIGDTVRVGAEVGAFVCDNDTVLLQVIGGLLEGLTCSTGQALEDVNQFFWCRNFNPIYTDFMYSGICDSSQSGLGWVAGSMVAISFCSIVVLLLRAAAYDIENEEQYWHSTFSRNVYHKVCSCFERAKDDGETKSILSCCCKKQKDPEPDFDQAVGIEDIVVDA